MSDHPTVYLNHAGTSWPKPDCVDQVISKAVKTDPFSWPGQFDEARRRISDFFHNPDISRMLLTPACTSSLSVAVSDQAWQPDDAVMTSCYEHHALHRALFKLTELGVNLEVLPCTDSAPIDLEKMDERLRVGDVKLVAVSAAANVTGELLPYEEIIELAHNYDVDVLLDGAQIAGWWDLDVIELGADMFCWAGHKALHGPWGVGGLFVAKGVCLNSLSSKCEVNDEDEEQAWFGCSEMPTYCDVGSANIWAMIGLAAALDWLDEDAQVGRLERARQQAARLYDAFGQISGVTVYGPADPQRRMPTVAFTSRKILPNDLGRALRDKNIVSSYGLQCAPLAHRHLGTGPHGVVRLSCGPLTTDEEIDFVIRSIEEIAG